LGGRQNIKIVKGQESFIGWKKEQHESAYQNLHGVVDEKSRVRKQ
jgi:hypothetical protein